MQEAMESRSAETMPSASRTPIFPLNVEMPCRQGPVVELLSQWRASVDTNHAAAAMCEAASRSSGLFDSCIREDYLTTSVTYNSGNLDKLKKLVDNKVDPNQGDYDLRTAIHVVMAALAAAELRTEI